MRESSVQGPRRGRRAFHAAVLAVALVVSATLVAFVPGEKIEQPRVATVAAAVVPTSMAPVLPDAQSTKRSVGAFFLLIAAIAAVMFRVARRLSWSAGARAGSSAVTGAALSAVRGRAPPRRTA